ncbi:MAG: glycosyltransferase [Candidatus Krumholzibacteriia bacterium]
MRVLQINKFFFEKGGTERYYFALSRALESRGHEVSHFSMHDPRNLPSPQARHFVGHTDLRGGYSALQSVPRGLAFIRSREAASKLGRLIAEKRPEIAHLHNIYHHITPSIIPVLEAAGVPVVMTLHDYKLICPNYSLFDGRSYCFRCRGGRFFRAPFARCSEGSFLKSALLAIESYWQKATGVYGAVKFFLAPSRYIRAQYVAEGFDEERVIYLPAFVESREGGQPAERRGDLPERYVLYLGRLSREKGLLTLMSAMERLDSVPLVVCGDGPLRDEMQRRAARAGDVRLLGHVERAGLQPVIAGAAAVVQPSESPENAPFSVLEAMALGTPVIVSDMGGLPELAERAAGKVFPRGDAEVLAQRVREVWRDGGAEAAVRGPRAIESDFSRDTHMERLEAVYRRAHVAGGVGA